MHRRYLLLINLKARRANQRRLKSLMRLFEDYGHDLDIMQTTGDESFPPIAGGYEAIIAAGGEGTINEAVNRMPKGSTLGIIPFGTANILSKELDIPRTYKRAAKIILEAKPENIVNFDLGVAAYRKDEKDIQRKFCAWCGVGFDAEAINEVNSSAKSILGKSSYLLYGFKITVTRRPRRSDVMIDDAGHIGYSAVVSNISMYGDRRIRLSPDADYKDGYLDVMLLEKENIISGLRCLGNSLTGRKGKDIVKKKCREIEIKDPGIMFHTDCELAGETPVRIRVLPAHIKVIRG